MTAEQNTSPVDVDVDVDVDVIVVGSGAAAMTGAYLAARAGLTTVVLEKTSLLGGTSAYSGAACWLPGTQVQQRADVPDSTESARTYLRALLGEDTDGKQEVFLARAPTLVAELELDPLLAFEFQAFPDYFDRDGRVPGGRSFVPRDLPLAEIGDHARLVRPPVDRDRRGKGHHLGQPLIQGRALIGRLLLALLASGHGTVRTDTSVDRLVVEDDRVVGVEVITPTGRAQVRARLGVLLAAGGFERDQVMRTEHVVPGEATRSMAPPGSNTGDPIRAAVAIGATTDLMDQAWFCPGLAMPDGTASFTLGFHGGLVVDQHGNRFANESLPYDQMGRALAANPARVPSYLIYDDRTHGELPAIALPGGSLEEHLGAGTRVRAENLGSLAELIGVPPRALEQTVQRFNTMVAAGEDTDFGRGRDEYDRFFARRGLVPVDRAPYYAATLVLSDLGTKGGLVTDTDGRVLRADGSPIPGLYAAGNTSASMTGAVYPGPGTPIATGMVFAAQAIADLAR